MYARLITAQVQPDKLAEFPNAFRELLLADVTQERGFKAIHVMKDTTQNKIVALVLWETEADATASVKGFMRQRLPKIAHLLTGQPDAKTLEVVLSA